MGTLQTYIEESIGKLKDGRSIIFYVQDEKRKKASEPEAKFKFKGSPVKKGKVNKRWVDGRLIEWIIVPSGSPVSVETSWGTVNFQQVNKTVVVMPCYLQEDLKSMEVDWNSSCGGMLSLGTI